MIEKDVIDKIYEISDIIEVIGDFVQLKKAGSSYKGLSPFTTEKTPSFVVSPAKRIWKCFSSNKGGNVVSFVMEVEQLSYPEALRYLAKKYNIEIVEKEQTAEDIAEANERESLFLVNTFAETYFQKQMHETDKGQAIALSYFRERGFRDDVIKKYGLGYNPEAWDSLTNAAKEAGYSTDYMLKAGLVKQKDQRVYDFFRGRVIFPIHSVTGRPLGFGARTLKSDPKIPKYLNSPETEIYNKSKVLYGMYQAKRAITNADNCFLVEGYTDVVTLHQCGVENVVASSGTSLTTEQIRLVKRFTNNVTILYDGDAAGIRASFRGIDMLLEEGLNVKVVLFPDGEDPDSYARRVSSTELSYFLGENAKDFIAFKTDLLVADTQGDPVKRSALVREIVKSVSLIPDMITRQVYIQECSRLMEMPEQTLISEMNKLRRDRVGEKQREKEREERRARRQKQSPPPNQFGLPPAANSGPPPGFDAAPPPTLEGPPPGMEGPPPGMEGPPPGFEGPPPIMEGPPPSVPYESAPRESVSPVNHEQAWQGEIAPDKPQSDSSTAARLDHQERDVLRLLLNYGDQFIKVEISDEKGAKSEIELPISYYIALELEQDGILLENKTFQKILDLYLAKVQMDDNNLPKVDYFLQHEDIDVSSLAVDLITSRHILSERWRTSHSIYVTTEDMRLQHSVKSSVYSLKLAKVEHMIFLVQEDLKKAKNDDEVTDLLAEQTVLNEARKMFSAELSRVVLK